MRELKKRFRHHDIKRGKNMNSLMEDSDIRNVQRQLRSDVRENLNEIFKKVTER